MAEIDIEVKQGILETYQNYPYSAPQVFAEFIDNAIQSAEDNKNALTLNDPEYILRVDIQIEWECMPDNVVRAKTIIIEDNAAGMTIEKFSEAFKSADRSTFRQGMNEFGMGMKVAACWLGGRWRVESKSIGEVETHVIDIDVKEVSEHNIKHVPSKDVYRPGMSHGTKITIDAWPTTQIKKDDEQSIKDGIASIYRYFLRRREVQIFFNDDLLEFTDYEVLKAPSYKNPYGADIIWKKNIDVDLDGTGKYRASGFLALLKDMDDKKRGVVIMRNKRVVMGFAPEGRTIGKELMGQPGSNKYRRVYGELEISGFEVAFGKNQIIDIQQLEALMKVVAGKAKIDDVSLLTQADKFRKKTKPQPVPQPSSQPASQPVIQQSSQPASQQLSQSTVRSNTTSVLPTVDISSSSTFKFGGLDWIFEMGETDEVDDLFANDTSRKSENVLGCKINPHHPFWEILGPPSKQSLAIIKALSIAYFKTTEDSSTAKASTLISQFEEIINDMSPD